MVEIILIMFAVIIILLYLLFKFGIVKRRVIVTIVESLPIGIFRDKDKSYEVENRVYVKGSRKDELNLNNEDNNENKNSFEGKERLGESEYIDNTSDKTVYWTPKGRTYHISKSCFALSRSKVIVEGTIEESEKNTLCDLCKDYL
ncbi:MAG TPA: hypothetical protein DG753_07395 [Clostridium sp.]|nr:hypothetical protein [Clostridium sp.]